MNNSFLVRLWVRLVNVSILLLTLYLIIFRIQPLLASSVPGRIILPLLLTYLVAAYLIAPFSVRLSGLLARRKRIPRYTSSVDGLATDPVNIVVIGSFSSLKAAYTASGWPVADKLTLRNSWRMATSFVTNTPYPTAPFSHLYLFGRKQDIGFQKPIGDSPRKRHHVRYWALDEQPDDIQALSQQFWHGKAKADLATAHIWVGAGTKDTGFGFTRGTFQISHAVDDDTIAERDFMVAELERTGMVKQVVHIKPNEHLDLGRVNSFISDGVAAVVYLREATKAKRPATRRAVKSR